MKIIQNPIQTQTTWTVPSVLSAISQHERGDFSKSALLADFYGRDERIAGCTNDRISALAGEDSAPFEFEVSRRGQEESASVIDDLEEFWEDLVTDEWLRPTIHDIIHLGISFTWITWDTSATEWRPVELTHFHASAIRWDPDKGHFVASTKNGQIEIRHNDPNWMITSPGGKRGWMDGAVRSLGLHYLMRDWNWRDFARFNEVHGSPIMAIIEGSQISDQAQKDSFVSDLADLGRSAKLRLPTGDEPSESIDVKLIEAMSKSYEGFDTFAGLLSTAISVRILGQNLSTEVGSGGSFAAAGVHWRVKQSVVRGDASGISSALRRGIILPYATANNEGFNRKSAPWPRWRLVIPEDLQAQAIVMQTASQALPGFIEAGFPIDRVAYANKFGIPLMEGAVPEGITTTPPDQDTTE